MFLVKLTLLLCSYWPGIQDSEASTTWSRFATTSQYANVRLLTALEGYIAPRYIPLGTPLIQARYECSESCAINQTCQAFNFFKTNTSYVCELQPDNLCGNKTNKAFVDWPGSMVWEKLRLGVTKTCFETLSPANNKICEVLRPGCSGGNWGNCKCVKHCSDCNNVYKIVGLPHYDCTLWPGGASELPIFGKCVGQKTCLMKREVNLSTGTFIWDYKMSFVDMNRIYRLSSYLELQFWFIDTSNTFYGTIYKNSFIDSKGTLMNMSLLYPSAGDIFNLKGGVLKPTPFVTVTDDRFGCGSFWLLDSSNATYCPGGKLGMLGTVLMKGTQVASTGIRHPAGTTLRTFKYASMELA